MVKPFALEEILARLRALLRRSPDTAPTVLEIGGLKLDPATRRADRHGRSIILTAKEFGLLEYFMRYPGRVINQSELLDHVWDYEYTGMSNVVETYIRYLRKKITKSGEIELIKTVRGQGYIMEAL